MLIDSLKDKQLYMKATLMGCLKEARFRTNLPVSYSYKTILRREAEGVKCYLELHRDPMNMWRMFTGKQIKAIVAYEIERAKENCKVSE